MGCVAYPKLQQKTDEYFKLFNKSYDASLFKVELYTRLSLIICGIIPLSANIFAIFVLQHPQLRRNQPTFRLHLRILAVTEIFYCATFVSFWTCDVTARILAWEEIHPPVLVVTIFAAFVYSALGTRNWVVVAISAARCEAITRPLTSLKKRIITTKSMQIFTAATVVITSTISFFYYLSQQWLVKCSILDKTESFLNATNTSEHHVKKNTVMSTVRNQFIISYFRGLPVLIVIIITVIIVIAINRKEPMLSQSHSQAKSATLTLLGFTTLFSLFEGFGFTYFFMNEITNINTDLSETATIVLYIFDKYLLLINSMTNVVAYVAFNKTFRCVAKQMLLTRGLSEC